MHATKPTRRNARLATAVALVALVALAPSAAADDITPTIHDDGSVTMGPCAGVDPWEIPPDYYVDVWSCIPV